MSSSLTYKLPLSLGNVIFSLLKRIFVWIFSQIAKAPLASIIVILMSIGSSLAITNALFFQSSPHPAPLFIEQSLNEIAHSASIQSANNERDKIVQSQPIVAPIIAPIKAPVPAVPEKIAKIKHQDIIKLQQKLFSLGFFSGKIDGFYGPQTAKAIRLFQSSIGQKPIGALTPELMLAVKHFNKPSQNVQTSSGLSNEQISPQTRTFNNQSVSVKPDTVFNPASLDKDPLLKIAGNVTNSAVPDAAIVRQVQLGLSSLGFLRGKIDGVAGEATSKAIRNFETYHNYQVTGKVSPELVDLLVKAGAKI